MYSARAIRILDTKEGGSKEIRPNIIYIVDTGTCPVVGFGWTMQESAAQEEYGITTLEIDETRAIDSLTDRIVNV